MAPWKTLTILTLGWITIWRQTVAGQAHLSVNFSDERAGAYRYQTEIKQSGQEYTISRLVLYRDSTLLLQYELEGPCEFIGGIVIIDDLKEAENNYKKKAGEEIAKLQKNWLNIFDYPMQRGIYFKCWYCMGESVITLPFP